MKKIKNILIATDFSTVSRGAYRYAKQLADELKATLTVVNVRESFMMLSDVTMAPFPVSSDEELINEMENFVVEENRVLNKITVLSELKIKILRGNVVDELVLLSQSSDVDLIVIGTTGLSDIITKIFGSVTLKLSREAYCPVLLVPRDVKWNSIDQVLYASNYDSISETVINEMVDLSKDFNSAIHFVNVKNFNPVFETIQKDIDWGKLLTYIDKDIHFETHTIYGNDTIEQLNKYCFSKNINMMVFVSQYRNFWEALTQKSITESILLSTTIPIMVIHAADK